MSSIEKEIKIQFEKYFLRKDWSLFKKMAEYYLKVAVFIKNKDVQIEKPFRLLARNVQKRLFIGIGIELLLKSFFLKKGYSINRVKDKKNTMKDYPFHIAIINWDKFHEDDTHTMNDLIQNIHKIKRFKSIKEIERGFRIAKVFRNKEGHVVVPQHKFDRSNYKDIEHALILFYKEGFSENLKVRFSLKPREKGIWSIEKH